MKISTRKTDFFVYEKNYVLDLIAVTWSTCTLFVVTIFLNVKSEKVNKILALVLETKCIRPRSCSKFSKKLFYSHYKKFHPIKQLSIFLLLNLTFTINVNFVKVKKKKIILEKIKLSFSVLRFRIRSDPNFFA